MSAFPPAFFERPQAFEAIHDDDIGGHVHDDDCEHEAVQHGDHVDYIDGHHAHFFKDGRWFRHHHPDAPSGDDSES